MLKCLVKSHDEEGKVTKYLYNGKSQLAMVMYPWTGEKAIADRKEAEEAGLYFTPDKGTGERYQFTANELSALRKVLDMAFPARGNAVQSAQLMWRETFTYDRNGNRSTKTTPWGTIRYTYDEENRLIKKGDVVYTNDKDGNTLAEKGLKVRSKLSIQRSKQDDLQ